MSELARHVKLTIAVVCQDIVQFDLNCPKGLEGLFEAVWLCVVHNHIFFGECSVVYQGEDVEGIGEPMCGGHPSASTVFGRYFFFFVVDVSLHLTIHSSGVPIIDRL